MKSDAAADSDSVLARAASGSRYTLLTQAARVACKALSVVVVARLVSPADHGLYAMAATVTMFLFLFLELGLGTAIVQTPTLTAAQTAAAHRAYLALGAVLALLTLALAPLAARFYTRPDLWPLMATMSASFLLNAAGGLPRALLRRDLNFKALNRIDTAAAIIGTAAMLLAAALGAGVYTFATFLLVSETVSSVGARRHCIWPAPACARFAEVRPVLQAGWRLTRYHLLNYTVQQVDGILVGRTLGAHALGLYNRAGQMLALPLQHVASPLSALAVAVLSRAQTDREFFVRHALTSANLIAHLTLPLTALAVAAPDELVRAILGEQWPGAAPVLRWLALSAAFTQIIHVAYAVCIAAGKSHRLTPMAVAALPLVFGAVWLGTDRGAAGVAFALAAVNLGLALPRLAWSLHDTPVSVRNFLGSLTGPLVLGLVLATGAAAGRIFAADHAWPWRLAAAGIGSLVAAAIALRASRRLRGEWRAVWMELRGSPASSVHAAAAP